MPDFKDIPPSLASAVRNVVNSNQNLYQQDLESRYASPEKEEEQPPQGDTQIEEAKKMKGEDPCWDGYEMVGKKKKDGKEVPNCVPKEETELEEASFMLPESASMRAAAKEIMSAGKKEAAVDQKEYESLAKALMKGDVKNANKILHNMDSNPRDGAMNILTKKLKANELEKLVEQVEQVDEISKDLALDYVMKATGKRILRKRAGKHSAKDKKRDVGIDRGIARLQRAESIEEAMTFPKKGLSRDNVTDGTYEMKAKGEGTQVFVTLVDRVFRQLGFDHNFSAAKYEKGITQKDKEMSVTIKLNKQSGGGYSGATITVKKNRKALKTPARLAADRRRASMRESFIEEEIKVGDKVQTIKMGQMQGTVTGFKKFPNGKIDKVMFKHKSGKTYASPVSNLKKLSESEEIESLEEKSVSQAQQKMMGMALAYKRGELKDASDEVKKMADSMSEKDLEDFAKTKHKGLPKKVEEGKLDKVDPKELKGKHKDREDKDIDNDGDVDKSDQFLHRRRKAISKAIKKEEVEQVDESGHKVPSNYASMMQKKKRKALKTPARLAADRRREEMKKISKTRVKEETIEEGAQADDWKKIQSMDKGGMGSSKRMAYYKAVLAHRKKWKQDTKEVSDKIQKMNKR